MKKSNIFSFVVFVSFALCACNGNKVSNDGSNDSINSDSVGNEIVTEGEVTADSEFGNIKEWEVVLTAISTVSDFTATEEEVKKLQENADENADISVEFDEESGEYYVFMQTMSEEGHAIIDDPEYVKQLNDLMEQEDYSEYRKDVTIKGNKAFAKWYGGNRGGGVPDDFPEELVNYLVEHLK